MRDRLRRILLPRLGQDAGAEMDDEIAAHVQLHIDAQIRGGASVDEARRSAAARFGPLLAERDALQQGARIRDCNVRRRDLLGAFRADIRLALRQMRRNALQSGLAVVTLGVGIGLTTAMFTLVEHVVIQPLPLAHPDQLVMIEGRESSDQSVLVLSNDDWLDWKAANTSFSAMAMFRLPDRVTLQVHDSAVRVMESAVSADYFRMLGLRFVAGRPLTPEEVRSNANVMVVSERFWRDNMGADPTLDGGLGPRAARVVGVVANDPVVSPDVDIWVPGRVVSYGGGATRNDIDAVGIARLRPGVTLLQASADLTRICHQIRARDGGGLYDVAADVIPLKATVIGDAAVPIRLLAIGVVMVLLLICVNLTISTLGRGRLRAGEMALRLALGASRRNLIQQLLLEQLVLAGSGCGLGLALAWVVVHTAAVTWADVIPRAGDVRVDATVLLFGIGVALLAGVASGIVPALRGSRVSPQGTLGAGIQRSIGGSRRSGAVLVAAEFALALSLMTGAALLVRSFDRLTRRALGYSRNIALADVMMPGDSTGRLDRWNRIMAAYASVPGVLRVGASSSPPVSHGGVGFIAIDGQPDAGRSAGYRVISESYFAAVGMHLLRGRDFGPEDVAGNMRTTIISETMARDYWGVANPVGQRIRAISMEGGFNPQAAKWLTIIGVVTDVWQYGYGIAPGAEMYVSFRQTPGGPPREMTIVASASIPAERLLPALRARTHEIAPWLGVDLSTVRGRLADEVATRRVTTTLLSGFAALALLLAALGIYAVLSYVVASRTREIALRMALGARGPDVLCLVVMQGVRAAVVGAVAGVVASAALSRVLSSMLVDVSRVDLISFGGSVALLMLVATAAAAMPAWRASRLDPMIALKEV